MQLVTKDHINKRSWLKQVCDRGQGHTRLKLKPPAQDAWGQVNSHAVGLQHPKPSFCLLHLDETCWHFAETSLPLQKETELARPAFSSPSDAQQDKPFASISAPGTARHPNPPPLSFVFNSQVPGHPWDCNCYHRAKKNELNGSVYWDNKPTRNAEKLDTWPSVNTVTWAVMGVREQYSETKKKFRVVGRRGMKPRKKIRRWQDHRVI